jgi:hypothetical protein
LSWIWIWEYWIEDTGILCLAECSHLFVQVQLRLEQHSYISGGIWQIIILRVSIYIYLHFCPPSPPMWLSYCYSLR